MKSEWIEYLKLSGLSDVYIEKADNVIRFYEELYPDNIRDIFVSEYVDKDGVVQPESLWIFTDNHVCEAKKFITEEDYDATTIKSRVDHWTVKKENYDFKEATDKSRLKIEISLNSAVVCHFKASGLNCDALKQIFLIYIFPNQKECHC